MHAVTVRSFHYASKYKLFFFISSNDVFWHVGVTEEQFKETWTRPGAAGMGEGTSLVVAKSRM